MSGETDKKACPNCGATNLILVSMDDEDEVTTWGLDPDEYSEDAEVWVCQRHVVMDLCWHEEADPDEAFDHHMRGLEWLLGKMADIQDAKVNDNG